MENRNEIMVFIEHHCGKVAGVSIELIYEAGRLASAMGGDVTAVAAGSGLAEELAALGQYGCRRVYYTEDKRLSCFTSVPCAQCVAETIKKQSPRIVLYGATTTGRAVAPRIASVLRCGLTADCTRLKIGDTTEKGTTYRNILYQIRPAFGGNIIATIISPESIPSMASVRPGVMKIGIPQPGKKASVILENSTLSDNDFPTEILKLVDEEKKVDLPAARIIVSAGMGAAASKESLELVKELARLLGGAVGASRPVVDSGILPKEHQVGQTGTTVRPNLYIACGISGQIQHRAGMSESKRIIAINTDPEAPIFKIADYGIIGDVRDVLPRMIKSYRENTGGKKNG
jgi:electron transfer flavoprotein alpha subunit